MIGPDEILEELNFWKGVRSRLAGLGLQSDGVMDQAIDVMCRVFNDALYGNDGKMYTKEQWEEKLADTARLYDFVKNLQCCDMDEVLFYKARSMLWATAIVAGIDPKESVDCDRAPVDAGPVDDITNITTEIV